MTPQAEHLANILAAAGALITLAAAVGTWLYLERNATRDAAADVQEEKRRRLQLAENHPQTPANAQEGRHKP